MGLKLGCTPWYGSSDFLKSMNSTKIDASSMNLIPVIQSMLDIYNFDHIEIRGDFFYINSNLLNSEYIVKLKDFITKQNLTISIHLPYIGIDLSSFNKHVLEASIRSLSEIIERTKKLDPLSWVLHTTGSFASQIMQMNIPDEMSDNVYRKIINMVKLPLTSLISEVNIDTTKIAIENTDFPFKMVSNLIEEFNTSVCFDIGHLLSKETPDYEISEFFDHYLDDISIIHLHDGTPEEGSHKALGYYNENFDSIIDQIKDNKLTTPIVFEMSSNSLHQSIKFLEAHHFVKSF